MRCLGIWTRRKKKPRDRWYPIRELDLGLDVEENEWVALLESGCQAGALLRRQGHSEISLVCDAFILQLIQPSIRRSWGGYRRYCSVPGLPVCLRIPTLNLASPGGLTDFEYRKLGTRC